jgi:hypothetical protein
VFRSRTRDDFSGGPIAARPYLSACDALIALGLIHQSRSIRYGMGIWGGGGGLFAGKARRLWPAKSLLDIAARHGLPSDAPRGLRGRLSDATASSPRAGPDVHPQATTA